MLKDKNVVLGVTGGIAAYKTVDIASRLRKAGANVHVILTEGAKNFVSPMSLREISGNDVVESMWDGGKRQGIEHISLANMADVFLIAPATANFIAKAANGLADDMLTTSLLATKAPIVYAPAMNTNMYCNPITQENIAKLNSLGWNMIAPDSGLLACGIEGVGRLPDPAKIVDRVGDIFASCDSMKGMKVLVTAGSTREPIDPVRYITNKSSGKMGYAIASQACRRGANVVLVSGPTCLAVPDGAKAIKVESAAQMRKAALDEFSDADITIMVAAVADYRAKEVSKTKIKKRDDEWTLVLEKNPDILKEMGSIKSPSQILVGFAAETDNLHQYALDKLRSKNLDFIVANDVSLENAGFDVDTNIAHIFSRDGSVEDIPLVSKDELAGIIIDRILKK